MALTDKLIAIGDAIRSKTYVLRGLTLTEMAEKINVDWIPPGEQKIKDYVKDFYIQDDGEHYDKNGEKVERDDDWEYIDSSVDGTGKPILVSYTTDGKILLTARTYKPSGLFKKTIRFIEWQLAEAPEGVTLINKTYDYSTPTGETGAIASCVILGVNKNCQLYVDCGSCGDYSRIVLNIYINYDRVSQEE